MDKPAKGKTTRAPASKTASKTASEKAPNKARGRAATKPAGDASSVPLAAPSTLGKPKAAKPRPKKPQTPKPVTAGASPPQPTAKVLIPKPAAAPKVEASAVGKPAAPVQPVAAPAFATAPAKRLEVPTFPELKPANISPAGAGPVLWVASEAIPLASTGGLGDVVGALPKVLRDLGWDVRVCLPYYRQQIKQPVSAGIYQFDLALAEPLRVVVRELVDPPNGVPTYLIDCPALFDRGGLYVDGAGAFVDNPYRFGVFQLAVLELAAQLQPRPCLIHSHDWHASLLPALVRLPGETAEKLHEVRTIFTIHNLQYQGDTERGIIDVLALPPESWNPDWAEHYGRFIPMKAAIMTADRVTTVSPTYAEELRGPIRGQGLDGAIRSRGHDMRGLINGIDDVAWNPATDKSLAANFSAVQLQGREACKRAVRAEVGLPNRPDRPLIGFIGRLVNDKGVDLIMDVLPEILALDAQVVILGSGEKDLESRLRALEAAYTQKGFRGLIKFDLALSRRLYSAFDMLLVPSRLEPCGLVQLYALRYGSVPIVHGVGGLRDTVKEGENGFVFHEPTPRALADAVTRAVALWDDRPGWLALQHRGMQQDWSWRQAAAPYDALYREVLSTPVRREPILPAPPPPAPAPPPPPVQVPTASFRLMVQGPRALFAYWDVDGPGPFELVVEERPSGVIFTAAAELPARGERWMGALPDQAYRALLRGRGGQVVALSNAVVTPLETAPEPQAQQPTWLESAVEVGVFEQDNEGHRWAAVFPDAATFTATKRGDLQPHWPHEAQSHDDITQHEVTLLNKPPSQGREHQPIVAPNPQTGFAAASLLTSARAAGASAWMQVPPKHVSFETVSYPRAKPTAHSGSLVHPLSVVPPGPRHLNLRDVAFSPTTAPVSGNAASPTSDSLAIARRTTLNKSE